MSEGIFDAQDWGGEAGTPGSSARKPGKLLNIPQYPTLQSYSAPNVKNAEVTKPWSKYILQMSPPFFFSPGEVQTSLQVMILILSNNQQTELLRSRDVLDKKGEDPDWNLSSFETQGLILERDFSSREKQLVSMACLIAKLFQMAFPEAFGRWH